ncbi:Sybindin-like protein [Catenaria anguillulae PL171]|uniref:Trafficking protein particle complex subunit n=1 Tax=Catenaria anguillulae PL171 TaxID=765915 RepID=A0A1Y2HP41_9FUNG|nr:Sybindin-like protein [Catenaria anguillulae PL171]
MFLGLWIINKAGGLIFQRDFASDVALAKVSTNDYLVLAGTFHSVHAIAARISPLPGSSGITSLETDTFTLTCHQTHTGTKFLIFTDPYHQNIDQLVRKVYDLYADYVMKNPFFTPEMPVRCEQFDVHLAKLVRSLNG